MKKRVFAGLMAASFFTAGAFGATTPTVDLTATGVAEGSIGDVIFSRVNNQPTGTGVFDPFLTIQSQGNNPIEQGYNTSGGLPLDDLRNAWNRNVRFGDLVSVTRNGNSYFVFELDANEPGQGTDSRFLSIDNIRIYTSPTGSQTTSNPDALGTLRYGLNSLNNPLTDQGNWVKIDASRNDITGQTTSGSGSSDMLVYIPTSHFTGVNADDFVYFYNLNGDHYASDDGTSADAGFEEWRAFVSTSSVPDTGSTLALLGLGLLSLEVVRRKLLHA